MASSMLPNVRWVLPILAFIMVTTVFLMSSTNVRLSSSILTPPPPAALVSTTPPPAAVTGFLVHTSGCRIPYMNAFDPGIRKYVKHVTDVQCSAAGPLILSNQTSLWVSPETLAYTNVSAEDLTCCYQAVTRKILKKYRTGVYADSAIEVATTCVDFKDSTDIHDEFVKVTCFLNGSEFHKDYHAFIRPKQTVLPKTVANSSTHFQKASVLIIGVDAVSRLNFHRQMPRTLKFLQSHSAIELLGYNKVDDNTFPNMVPVLSGQSVEELQQTCWKKDDDVFDKCPFMWKNFSASGYQTGFGEDACWMGLFQYLKSGFFIQPVDNYLHTMMKLAEDDIGHAKDLNAKICVGPRTAGQVLFDYAEKFATNLTKSGKPFFGFFWGTSLTHDYLNVQPQTDVIYETLLRNLGSNNVFNNTVVVFLSDHGIRWGPIRETYQGRVEERLPFVFFLLPSWLEDSYPSAVMNLRRNRRMLTSPFDLHETLMDLLTPESLSRESLAQRSQTETSSRGISLFLPVPEARTCEDAGITDNWCTCHQSHNISLEDPIVQRAANTVVAYVNEKLFPYMQCAQLTLQEVKTAQLESPRAEVKSSSNRSIQDVTVVLVTSPGLAEFEATVRHHLEDDISDAVLGYVSRINTYGDQSRCVDNFHMRLYCYCS